GLELGPYEMQVGAQAAETIFERDAVDLGNERFLPARHELRDENAEQHETRHAFGDRQRARDSGWNDVTVTDRCRRHGAEVDGGQESAEGVRERQSVRFERVVLQQLERPV